jgi:hypothetical protein
MSVDVKDHRKFLEGKLKDADKLQAEKPKPLLEQRAIASETGDPRLDKMLRAVAAMIEKDDAHIMDVSIKGMAQLNPDAMRLAQAEYFYTKGRVDALQAVVKIPEQIILEERGIEQTTH